MDGPLVSLIMAVWEPRPDWFRAAAASALGQTGCDIELIIVDDGCLEPAAALLADLADPRLTLIRIEHGGVCRARNARFAAARGARIRFIDCDDVISHDSTSHLSGLTGEDRVITYGATVVCDEMLRPRSMITAQIQGPALVQCVLSQFDVRVPSMLFPRSVVVAAGEWDPSFRIFEDWDFVLRALEHAPVRGDQHVATHYRHHGRSATGTVQGEAVEAAWQRLLDRYFPRHPDQRDSSLERMARASQYINCGLDHWRRGVYGPSLARIASAGLLDPKITARELARFLRRRFQWLVGVVGRS